MKIETLRAVEKLFRHEFGSDSARVRPTLQLIELAAIHLDLERAPEPTRLRAIAYVVAGLLEAWRASRGVMLDSPRVRGDHREALERHVLKVLEGGA